MFKIIKKKISYTIILLFFLTGCLPKVSPTGGPFSALKMNPGKSRIIIFREGISLLSPDTPQVIIKGKTSLSFFLPNNAFIQEDIIEGPYKIIIKKADGASLVWRLKPIGIQIKAQKNKTVYLELKAVSSGLIHSARINSVSEIYALTKLVELQKVLSSDKPK